MTQNPCNKSLLYLLLFFLFWILVFTMLLYIRNVKSNYTGTSLVVLWLRLHTPSAEGTGLISGQRNKILHVQGSLEINKEFKQRIIAHLDIVYIKQFHRLFTQRCAITPRQISMCLELRIPLCCYSSVLCST